MNQVTPSALGMTTPSVHRAFVYSAALPGLGLWYLGQRVIGALAIAAIVLMTLWFVGAFAVATFGFTAWFSGQLMGQQHASSFSFSAISLGLPAALFYLLWSATIFASLYQGRLLTRQHGIVQANPYWGIGMSAVCPGAGQFYTGSVRLGVALFVTYLVAAMALWPSLQVLSNELVRSMGERNSLLSDTQSLVAFAHDYSLRLDYSFGRVAMQIAWVLSVALAAATLGRTNAQAAPAQASGFDALGSEANRVSERIALRVVVVVIASWLLPGAAQLADARPVCGWVLCGIEAGLLVIGAFLFAVGVISTSALDSFNSARSYLVLLAIVEMAGCSLYNYLRSRQSVSG